jgi:hypothetical protein
MLQPSVIIEAKSEMKEMDYYNKLDDKSRRFCHSEAQRLLLWIFNRSAMVAVSDVCNHPLKSYSMLYPTLEGLNSGLCYGIDEEIVRSLDKLVSAGVPQPMLPLCAAVWKEASSIPLEDIELDQEPAIELMMLRVQSTASILDRYKKTKEESLADELAVRRFKIKTKKGSKK